MKATRIINRTATALLLLGAVACNEAFEVPEGEEVVVSDKDIYLSASVYYDSYGKESFSADGDEGEFRVSANWDNDWVISDIPDWLSFEQTSGSGYESIDIEADENTSTSPRVAVISVTAEGFYVRHCEIKQDGVTPYIRNSGDERHKSHIYGEVSGGAASYYYELDTNIPTEDIEVSVDVDWITAHLQGNKLNFLVETNPSIWKRYYGNIKLSYDDTVYLTYSITQNGVSASLESSTVEASPMGGLYHVTVEGDAEWLAEVRDVNQSWISVEKQSESLLDVTVTPNNTTSSRSGSIYICIKNDDGTAGTRLTTLYINQDPISLSAGNPGGTLNAAGTNSVTVNIDCNTDWEVYDVSAIWFSVSPESGKGPGTLTVKATAPNPNFERRRGSFRVRIPGTDVSTDVFIEQEGVAQGVGESTLEMPWKASSRELQLNIAGTWQAAISESWIHLDRTQGDGSATLSVSVDRNDGMEARTGYITFASINQTFTITVNQQSQYFTLDSTAGTVTALGGSINLSVSSSIGSQAEMWSSADDHTAPEWVSISNTSGNSYTITAAANPSGLPRTAVAAFTPTEEEAADSFRQGLLFNVTQEGRRLAANVTSIDVTRSGGTTETYTLTVDGEFSIEKGADDFWYMLVTDGAAFRLVVTPNTGEENRTGAVTVRLLGTPEGEESTLTIPVVQYGKGANIGIGGFGPDEDWTIKAYKR